MIEKGMEEKKTQLSLSSFSDFFPKMLPPNYTLAGFDRTARFLGGRRR
jgi:hypothetical protein